MGVEIRKIQKKDAGDMSRIYQAITSQTVHTLFERIADEQSQSNVNACFVAELDGQVVGFMVSYFLRGGFGLEESAWITTLGIDPDHMDQGIGLELAKAVLNFYKNKGVNNIYTSVKWDSTDLLSFFKTLGFERSEFINLRRTIA